MSRTGLKILIVSMIICAISILSIYSSTNRKEGEFWQTIYQRQLIWVALGIISFYFFSRMNYRRLWDLVYALYAVILLLLMSVFVLGIVRSGAQRWLKIGWFNLQPSEFAKLILVIFMARYFSKKTADDVSLKARKFGMFKALILPFMFAAVPIGLIIEQPDLGSGLLVFFIFFSMLYMSNIRLRYPFIALALFVSSIPVFWNFLRDYQKERIFVFLNPNIDPLGSGYTMIQAKIAIGSGGFFGKGWLAGTQSQLRFLPESHTDFIFSTFAEEWGFLGAAVLLGLYYFLIHEGMRISEKTSDHFGKLLSLGITLMLGIQVFINIAMNLGLAPIVGLPLPLLSYGGSSVIVTFMALGILVNIDKTRAVF